MSITGYSLLNEWVLCIRHKIYISYIKSEIMNLDNTPKNAGAENEDRTQSHTSENSSRLNGKKDVSDDAREEAMGDIEEDADLSIHSPNDDLDEGETARLGEGKNELI